MDTTTGNPFAELERLGGLEPFATRREILDLLREASANKREDRHTAASQLPRTKIGSFSEAEVHAFESEGWTVVSPRKRTRPAAGLSIGDAPTHNSVAGVIPRALSTGVRTRRTPAALPTQKRFWRYLRWGALGAIGAIALAKLASRR